MSLLKAHILLLILCGWSSYTAAQDLLVPWLDTATGLYGYANRHGEVVIPPQWMNAYFFAGNRALVVPAGQPKYTQQHFALIDTTGKYLIPPERRWVYRDTFYKQQYQLNCFDARGRWGWVNDNNELRIPYDWDRPRIVHNQPMADSLLVVAKNGLAGVVDFSGNVVLPCRYGQVDVVASLFRDLGAFIVTDANDETGPNNKGVVLANGQVLVPMKYRYIEYITTPHRGFHLTFEAQDWKQHNNWVVERFMHLGTSETEPWVETKFKPGKRMGNGKFYLRDLPGNYYALYDTGGTLVKNSIINTEGDSIVIQSTFEHRSDTAVYTTARYRLPDLVPIHSEEQYTWMEPWKDLFPLRRSKCGNAMRGYDAHSYRPTDVVNIPQSFERFFKDSFVYSTQKALVHRRDYHVTTSGMTTIDNERPKVKGYLVQGENRFATNEAVFAIVDDSMHYILPPFKTNYVYFVNMKDSLIGLPNGVYRFGPKGLGNRLEGISSQQIINYFLYKDRLYKCFNATGKRPVAMPTDEAIYGDNVVGDTIGQLKGSWKYCRWIKEAAANLFGSDTIAFWAKDTAGYITLLDPDGNELLPWLSGKYKAVTAYGQLLLTENGRREKTLLCKNGTELVPGCKVWVVRAIGPVHKPNEEQNNNDAIFYLVNCTLPSGKSGMFYVDAAVRAYTSAYSTPNAGSRSGKSKKHKR